MLIFKKFARKLQKFLEKRVFSNFLEKMLWKTKHLYRWQWDKISVSSHDMKHRHGLVDKIISFDDIESVLEVGCAAAPNLRLLRQKLPKAKLIGCDINPKCISTGNDYFRSVGDPNAMLYVKSTDQLTFFEKQSIDIVFTQACLLLLPPSKIYSTLKNLFQLSKKGLILHELHMEGAVNGYFADGRWVYDYVNLIKRISPNYRIEFFDTTFEEGAWIPYGKIMKISFV